MKKIKEIKIQNFKAFQQEQVFPVNGKHVLVYGNNGSGKSSLFWALYTLLQSSIKDDDGVKKYLEKYVASNKSTHQTLKNVFMDENDRLIIDFGLFIQFYTDRIFPNEETTKFNV